MLGLIMAATLTASTPPSPPLIFGAGVEPCGDWTKWADQYAVHGAMVQWVQGYLARAAYADGQDLMRGQSVNSLEAFMSSYCTAHPLEPIQAGVVALEAALLQRARAAP